MGVTDEDLESLSLLLLAQEFCWIVVVCLWAKSISTKEVFSITLELSTLFWRFCGLSVIRGVAPFLSVFEAAGV